MLVDGSGSQFHSTLEPLTKEQRRSIKAAASAPAAGSSGKKPRGSGKGKAGAPAAVAAGAEASAAAQAAGPAATDGGAAGGSRLVGLCLLPIAVDELSGGGAPGPTMYFMPLAAGTFGGHEVAEEAATQGRDLAAQLVANPEGGAILAFNMQGGRGCRENKRETCWCWGNSERPWATGLTLTGAHPPAHSPAGLPCPAHARPAGLLRLLGEARVALPAPHRLALVDPRLLAWLLEPQLLQVGGLLVPQAGGVDFPAFQAKLTLPESCFPLCSSSVNAPCFSPLCRAATRS